MYSHHMEAADAVLVVDTDISASVHAFAPTVSAPQIHHSPEPSSYSHCSLRSICHSHLLFADSKQRNMWLTRPACKKSTVAHSTSNFSVGLYMDLFHGGK